MLHRKILTSLAFILLLFFSTRGISQEWGSRKQLSLGAQYLYQSGSLFLGLAEFQVSFFHKLALGLLGKVGSHASTLVKVIGVQFYWYTDEILLGPFLGVGGNYYIYGGTGSALSGSLPSVQSSLGWRMPFFQTGATLAVGAGPEVFFLRNGTSVGATLRLDIGAEF